MSKKNTTTEPTPDPTTPSTSASTALATPADNARLETAELKGLLRTIATLSLTDLGRIDRHAAAESEAAHDEILALFAENPDLGDTMAPLLDAMSADVEGIEDGGGTMIPYVSMRQKMTREEKLPDDTVKVGHLYTATENLGNEIFIIPLHFHRKRTRFVQGSDRPDCKSLDGVMGSKHGACVSCPYGRWEEGVKTSCSNGIALTALTEDLSRLIHIDFQKTSTATGKRLQTLAKTREGVFKRSFRLYTEKTTNDHGEYCVFKVAPTGRVLEGETYAAARLLYRMVAANYHGQQARIYARIKDPTAGAAGALGAGSQAAGALSPTAGDEEPDFEGSL